MGYKIEFDSTPFQEKIPTPIKFNDIEVDLIQKEVSELLQKGAIKEVSHENGEFISNVFLVKKKNGKFRPVINLKNLNEFVTYHHFKQENLSLILKGIQMGSFFTSIDLTDAYLTVPVHESDRKYLKFMWGGKLYAFTCLAFGLASAPRVFTKIMKVVFSHIRRMGIDSYFYIDDSLLQAENYAICENNTKKVKNFIESTGFYINNEKSVFIPSQRITFLGYIIDSVLFRVFLPEEKIQKIIELSNIVLRNKKVQIRHVAQLVGLFSSAQYAITHAHLFHRYLDIDKTKALKKSNKDYNAFLHISEESKSEIIWWLENIRSENGKLIREDPPIHFLHTDSSMIGWGAFLDKKSCSTQGLWNLDEKKLHINILELKAIYFGLVSLCRHIKNAHLRVRTDSSTAVNYINNQGGAVIPLLVIAKQIWVWCRSNNIFISAVHIPGHQNVTPDNLSRCFQDTSEWKLKESVFCQVVHHFFMPDTDLFASRLNKQLQRYVSWFPDPEAWATDAFSFSWHNLKPYVFPPFSQINKVLIKIEEDQVRKVLLIVPLWTTQAWFPKLLKLLIALPVKLPQCSDLLILAHNQQKHQMNKRKLFLVACLVSGEVSLIKDFQKKLQKSCHNLGENLQTPSMNILGEHGYCGVIENKLIPLNQL